MKYTLKKKNKSELMILLTVMTIVNIVFYWKFIIGKEYFLVSSDMAIQQYSELVNFIERIGQGVRGWSFSVGMGNGYDFSGFTFSMDILLLFFGKENLKYTFIWYHLIKMYLAAILFYLALTKLGIKQKIAVYGALCYVYSATFIVRSFWASYALEFVLFALLLYALECYFQDNNWLLLVVAVVLLGSQLQLYYMVVYSVAMLCYALLRNYLVTNYHGKKFWKYIGCCASIMLISIIILAYRLIPEIMSTFSSSRVASVSTQVGSSAKWENLLLFAKPDRLIASFNSFFAISLEGAIGNTTFCPDALDGPLFYVGILVLLLLPQCVKLLKNKGKKVWLGLFTFIVVYCMIPAVSYLCNLGADEDYFKLSTMWMIAFLIFSAAYVLDKMAREKGHIDKKLLYITYAVLMVTFIGLNLEIGEFKSRLNMIMFGKVIIYLSVWSLFLLACNKVKNKRIVSCMFMIIACSEIYFFIHPTMVVAENLADGLKYVVDTEENQKLIDEIKEKEQDDFYRIYFRDQRMVDYNTESVLYNFNSMGYGGQSVKSGYVNFLKAIEAESTYRPVWKRSNGFLSRYMIDSLASVKYAVLDKKETPPRGFEKIGENEKYNIYRNNYSMPLGVTIDKIISTEDFEKLSIRQKDVALLNSIVSDETQENNLTQYQNELNVEVKKISPEKMYLEGITLDKKNDMYEMQCKSDDLNCIYLQTKDMQWMEGNEYIVSFKFYSPTENSIFIQWNEGDSWKQKIIAVAEGMNDVNYTIDYKNMNTLLMYFQKGTYQIGNLHYESCSEEKIDEVYKSSISEKSFLQMNTYEDNLIDGTIETKKDSFLLFMIPFDENWEIYVDGKKMQLQQVDYGFMGVEIMAGKHDIRLRYVPDSNVVPICISTTGIIFLVGFMVLLKNGKKKTPKRNGYGVLLGQLVGRCEENEIRRKL